MSAVLHAEGLTVELPGGRAAVDDVSIAVGPGEILGLVGESGSGKTTLALALLGYARPGCRIVAGSVEVAGTRLTGLDEAEARRRRGRVVSYVPQDPAAALNPSLRIGRRGGRRGAASTAVGRGADSVLEALGRVHLPADAAFARRYPHELSGGQQQRVTIATALVCEPAAVVMDEPTTGLDVVTQARILEEVERLRSERGIAVVYVSHDLAVVASIADRVAVMYEGRIVEEGDATQVITRPRHEYTQRLVASIPQLLERRPVRSDAGTAILTVDGLGAAHGRVPVVDDVSFELERGACLAIVGESGSGKTTIARCVAGLHAPSAGAIRLDGEQLAPRARSRTRHQRRQAADRVPEPVRLAQPETPDPGRDRAAGAPPARHLGRETPMPRSRVCSSGSACRAGSPAGSPASSPAASASGLRSRAPLRPGRSFSCATRSRPRSTCPCRRRCWSCSRSCARSSGFRCCSSRTTSPSSGRSPTTCSCSRAGASARRGSTAQVLSSPQDDYTRRLLEAAPSLPAP